MRKYINIEVWRDFYDEQWRIKVLFWKWEVARFKFETVVTKGFGKYNIKPVITPTNR